jgi:hypothetical protein
MAKQVKEKIVILRVEIADSVKQQLRVFAATKRRPMNNVVTDLIRTHCK